MKKLILGVTIASLCALAPLPAFAGPAEKTEAVKTIETCLGSGIGVPTALIYDACIRAFDVAITEAQKVSSKSETERGLLWLQATTAASLAMLTKLKIDGAVSQASCNIALQGLKADSQVPPTFKEIRDTSSLKQIYDHCLKSGFYEYLKK